MNQKDKETKKVLTTAGEDTIAAVATAFGEGGIGIVRISGEKALDILGKIFVSQKEKDMEERKLTYGSVRDPKTGEDIDEVMAVFMKGPKTYTCEDIAEIDCHGSVVSLQKILALVLDKGARLAEKGEFTKRAFLNGRLDLSQAEAVTDLVAAKTDAGQKQALGQLKGRFSDEVGNLRGRLMNELVNMAVNIDYPDEDIEVVVYEDLRKSLKEIKKEIDELLETAETGRIIREGLKVAIAGKPNAGKSSLLNALLGEERAIVTDIPGTTRDAITEQINLSGIPVNVMDTAGIREAEDEIEKIGINKSKEGIEGADLVLLMLDGSKAIEEEDEKIVESLEGKKVLTLVNKNDLEEKIDLSPLPAWLKEGKVLKTSFADGGRQKKEDVEKIGEAIGEMVMKGKVLQENSLLVTNARHANLLRKSGQLLEEAIAATEGEEALELIEIDVKEAYESLGEILGETYKDDIINEVFARFCLGK